ncbi:MAG: phosphate acyltransferase PlsX [Candidatus Margulisbacteria bacterium]|nr:phosphate acyltransferase PlsX [Candidatus Margulisiibacteriota bacterium]MBU1021882.1 phosphate acyltransferase PlsX [Candidatus Margulisiibacteriota bacterium]MBU1728520.1 phosphate acyltransferase PlsX [Candidatus Margulisiibacteriota bacterium]MBU1954667.1 phosphate acyltransferase PlsX [Candidatus Margulisiibacteriota bacterium]
MGGDHAPREIVKGALSAAKEYGFNIILVGDELKVKAELSRHAPHKNLSVVNASQVIEMNESPVAAVKQKKDASVNIAVALVKNGQADAIVSAGNTGALMTAALFGLGRIKGIERPAIATVFPTEQGPVLLLDMGANVDCKAKHLVQFAQMGSVFAEHALHRSNPRVGLLNIGEEPEKGNELTLETYPLLKNSKLNFVGNVESKEILNGKVDVVVCDGFVGNLILKFSENLAGNIVNMLKKELKRNPVTKLGALMLSPALMNLKKMVDYDEYGGAPLLGLAGVCYKAHGRAKAKAIKNALRVAGEAATEKVVDYIKNYGA